MAIVMSPMSPKWAALPTGLEKGRSGIADYICVSKGLSESNFSRLQAVGNNGVVIEYLFCWDFSCKFKKPGLGNKKG